MSAHEWNAVIHNLARLRAKGGIGILTSQTGSGQVVSADPRYREWRHPWHVLLRWEASLENWVATVRAGFVNGVVPTVVEALPDEDGAIDRERPLDLSRGIVLDAWLGYGRANAGVQSARVPDYFLRRGSEAGRAVVETESPLAQLLDGGPIKREDRQPGERFLLSCDIVLHQPRPGVRIESTVLDPLTDAAGLQMSPTIATPRDRTPFLRAVAQMPPDTPPDPLEILMGTYQEPLEDTLLIVRVYLLSPPDQVDPTPTAEWSPLVTHKVFWMSEAGRALFTPQPGHPTSPPAKPCSSPSPWPEESPNPSSTPSSAAQTTPPTRSRRLSGPLPWPERFGRLDFLPRRSRSDVKILRVLRGRITMPLDKPQQNEEDGQIKAEEAAEADAAFLDPPFPYRAMPAPDWAVIDSAPAAEDEQRG